MFLCDVCGRTYKTAGSLRHHVRRHHEHTRRCDLCNLTFTSLVELHRHSRRHEVKCVNCPLVFKTDDEMLLHNIESHHEHDSDRTVTDPVFKLQATSFRKFVQKWTYNTSSDSTDVEHYLNSLRHHVEHLIHSSLRRLMQIKIQGCISLILEKLTIDGTETRMPLYLCSKVQLVLSPIHVENVVNSFIEQILRQLDEFNQRGSGWIVVHICQLDIHLGRFMSHTGGCGDIVFDDYLKSKRAVLNVKCTGYKCLVYSVLACLHPVTNNAGRASHYTKYLDEINVTGISFPTPLSEIAKFESQNGLAIYVYGYENKNVFPLYISKQTGSREVMLLLVEDRHYCLIRNFNALARTNTSRYVCPYCLMSFDTKLLLEKHLQLCRTMTPQHVEMPTEPKMQFTRYDKQLPHPYLVYADFECLLVKLQTCKPNPKDSYIHKTHAHTPSGYSYVVIGPRGEVCMKRVYRGTDCVKDFFHNLLLVWDYVHEQKSQFKPLVDFPVSDWVASTHCHICEQPFQPNQVKVRDHDHIFGTYRGPAHQKCNLLYKFKQIIPVMFHNLKNYDSHIITLALPYFGKEYISVIPQNTERFTSIRIGNKFQFLDTYQFLSVSLSDLVDTVDHFPVLEAVFPTTHQLLKRKGIYPYEYVDSFSRFEEDKLPGKDAFYSALTMSDVSDDDYNYAKMVWDSTGCASLGAYHDLYVMTDTCLLADCFEKFRKVCLTQYKLDACHYFTLPGLTFDAALRMTGEVLELFTDVDMYNMCESGIRGGVSMISHRYSKANNPLLSDYNSSEDNKYIIYLDANNLYGYCLCMPMPYSGFRWLSDSELTDLDLLKLPANSNVGYILEVDLSYPDELHDKHCDFPMAPENIVVTDEMLSPFNRNLRRDTSVESTRLVPHLMNRTNYVCYYKNLIYYLQQGLILTKIHRAIRFEEKAWIKPYVDFNTARRIAATSEFERTIYKNLNNSLFGKTIQCNRRHINIRLTTTEKQMLKTMRLPSVEYFDILTEDLVMFKLHRIKVLLDRPIYVGFSVLELAKKHMYEFFYGHIKQRYGANARLLSTDTDSLLMEIQASDVYSDMLTDIHLYDTSNYPSSHALYSKTNCKVPGLMKDETAGEPIHSFIGLKSKLYTVLFDNDVVYRKVGKGISRSVLQNIVTPDHYLHCLRDHEYFSFEQYALRSFRHNLFSIVSNKLSLSAYDCKRFIESCGVKSLPYGHYRIPELLELNST